MMGSGGRGVSICPATFGASLPSGSGLSARSPRPSSPRERRGSALVRRKLELLSSCGDGRRGLFAPSRTRCRRPTCHPKSPASLRATATRTAIPRRLATFMPQARSADHSVLRISSEWVIAHLGSATARSGRRGVGGCRTARSWLTRSRATRFKLCVTHGIDLSKLSHAEKDDLILSLLPLVGQLEAALARIAELEKRLAAFERPPKTPTIPRCRRRRARSPIVRPATSRPARAVPASAVRWSRTRTASSMPGSMPARIAPPPSPPSSRRRSRCTTASSCRRSSRT